MYAWYFPKDAGAHRHDWEDIVVWLSDRTNSARVLGISYSEHGSYSRKRGNSPLDGSHPTVLYDSDGTSHRMFPEKRIKGSMQPLINYAQIPDQAHIALRDRDWRKANVPFIDRNYVTQLEKARL